MDHETIERLLELNRGFYASFAEHFAASRSVSDPALTAILPYIPSRARILDVGCGNGRLASLLEDERPGCTYVGVDAVPELIAAARDQTAELSHTSVAFRVLDVADRGWTTRVPAPPDSRQTAFGFDCAVVLAVLHHVPGFHLRVRLLRDVGQLLQPNGHLIVSAWRFTSNPRMRRKIVKWDIVGIDEDRLDPDDYLLDWKRGGRGFRYCHLIDEDELQELASASRLTLRETFRAGGREGDLSLYAVLDQTG